MPMVGWSDHLSRTIERYVKEFVLVQPTLYNFFQTNGLVRNIGEGIDKLTYFDWKQPEGAQMATTIHDANVIVPRLGETTVGLLYLAYNVQISENDIDKFKNNQWIGGNLIQETVNRTIPVMINQVDQFLAWGDEMKDEVKLDPFSGKGEFFGIFNGGTAVAAGIDGGDDVQVAGDYLATVWKMRKALLSAAHSLPKYMLFSDLDTKYYATLENQFYSQVGITEYQRIRNLPFIQDWIVSPNFIDKTELKYRMAMIAPKQRIKRSQNKGSVVPTMELVQGYPFVVKPAFQGGMDDKGFRTFKIIWSGRLIEYYSTAIQRTGTLTLT